MSNHSENFDTGECDRLIFVLYNSLICENIVQHLTLRDLKAASLVNSNFCRMIRCSRRFREKVVLVLPEDAEGLENTEQSQIQIGRNWRSEAVVDLSHSPKIFNFILESTQNLSITAKMDTDFWTYTRSLQRILQSSPSLCLKMLCLTTKMVDGFEASEFGLIQRLEALGLLENLESLHLIDWNQQVPYAWRSHLSPVNPIMARLESSLNGDQRRKVESLSVVTNYREPGIEEFFRDTIAKYSGSIQDLRLYMNVWNLTEMESVQFPCLKSLLTYVETGSRDERTFVEFLKRHGESLVELDLRAEGPLSEELVDGIRRWGSKLRKLHVGADCFSEVCCEETWSFLKFMSNLSDFRITIGGQSSIGMGSIALSTLPRNQLTSLNLRYEKSPPQFSMYLKRSLLLKKFRGLRCLRLIRCRIAVDDKLMQGILRKMTELEELEVSFSSDLTVLGLTGENRRSGVGLRNLTKLKSFTIRYCESLKPDDMLKAVALQELQILEYSSPTPITVNFVILLTLQNPSLKTIAVPAPDSQVTPEEIQRILMEENHPIRNVVFKG